MTTWQGQNVLVTGGAGFIGSHLAQRLIQEGASVTILDPHATSENQNLKDLVSFVSLWPARVEESLEKLDLRPFDCIFHLAGNPYVLPSVENPMHRAAHLALMQ